MSSTFRWTRGRAFGAIILVTVIMLRLAANGGDAGNGDDTDAMTHLRILAADAMEGRGLGQAGLARALDYAESVMAASGLEPAFVDDGGRASFRQDVPVIRYTLGEGNGGVLTRAGERHELSHPEDMLIFRPGKGGSTVAGGVAYVGYGIREPDLGRDDYGDLDVRGRWVVMLEGRPAELSPMLEEIYGNPDRSGDRILDAALQAGAVGLIVVMPPEVYEAWSVLGGMYATTVFAAAQHYVGGAQADCEIPVVVLSAEQTEFLFRGTGRDPVAGTGDPSSFVLTDAHLSARMDARRAIIHSANLAGVIRGSEAPDELVGVSAHIDHLGVQGGEIYNGANDDASGCAAVLATASRLARSPQPRSVVCVLFTGEETGHFGSLHFLSHPPPGRWIAGVNLEHVGRSRDGTFLTTAPPAMLTGLDAIARERGGMRTNALEADGQIIRGSDGYSFFLHGVPIVTMGGGGFPEYHGPGDDVDRIDGSLLGKAVELSVAMVRWLASDTVTPLDEE